MPVTVKNSVLICTGATTEELHYDINAWLSQAIDEEAISISVLYNPREAEFNAFILLRKLD